MKFRVYLRESFSQADFKKMKKEIEKHLPKEDIKMSTTFTKIGAKKTFFVEIPKNKTFPKGFYYNVTTENAADAKAAALRVMMDIIDRGEDVSKVDWRKQL
jgi:hypothetical protein